MPLFGATRALERKIDEFYDALSEGLLVFREAIAAYLEGNEELFARKLAAMDEHESRADVLSADVEAALYSQSLIPEFRGDVLGLLEHGDNVIDRAQMCLQRFDVERPAVPERWRRLYGDLTAAAYACADATIMASRRFFREPAAVSDFLVKVHHFESEADEVGLALRRGVFSDPELDLARRQHLRYFAEAIDRVADVSQNVADRLAISVIKRRM
ncbi:MAG: DUF47 family protein [Candidatus Krumholzibacteriia bacterium]